MLSAIISDLHLEHDNITKTLIFTTFLTQYEKKINKLFILGDLFEYWINDKLHIPKHQLLINTLRKFNTPNKRVFIMRGNRDFLLGSEFAELTKCEYIEDPFISQVGNTKTLLTHGDLFLTKNKFYILYRKLSRLTPIQNLFQLLPNNIKQKIALKLRNRKKRVKSNITYHIYDKPLMAYAKKLNITQVVSGHIHVPFINIVKNKELAIKHYSLNQLDKKLNILFFEENGTVVNLRNFKP